MAIPAQGFTVTWSGDTLQEIAEVSVDRELELIAARGGYLSLERGTVRVSSFSDANLSVSEYGRVSTLVIKHPPVTGTVAVTLFDGQVLLDKRRVSVTANDVVRFDIQFKILN